MKNVKKVWIPKSTTLVELTSVCGSPLVAVKLRTACPASAKLYKERREARMNALAIRGQRIDPQKVKNAPHIFRHT